MILLLVLYCHCALITHKASDFQLPNVESKLDEVKSLIENDIEIAVKRGKRAFDSIATEIQNKVQRSIPEIKAKILDAGKTVCEVGILFSYSCVSEFNT